MSEALQGGSTACGEEIAPHYCLPENRSSPGCGTRFTDNRHRLAFPHPQIRPAMRMRYEGRKDISKTKPVRKLGEHTS